MAITGDLPDSSRAEDRRPELAVSSCNPLIKHHKTLPLTTINIVAPNHSPRMLPSDPDADASFSDATPHPRSEAKTVISYLAPCQEAAKIEGSPLSRVKHKK